MLVCPQSSWRPLAVGSSPNMTELTLLTQGDWDRVTTAHNIRTKAYPLALMRDTCNWIRVRTPWGGGPHGEMALLTHQTHPLTHIPTPSNFQKTQQLFWKRGYLQGDEDKLN